MMHTLSASTGVPSLGSLKPLIPSQGKGKQLTQTQLLQISSNSLESHIGSVLVLSEEGTILYATESLQDRLVELDGASNPSIPQEIRLIFQVLQQCRDQFPSQNWAIEFDIFTKDAIALHIRSRWLKLDGLDKPCISIVLEDRQQMVQDMVLTEVQDWGLTPREQEVWLLHRDGFTYNQIADKLYITVNTVKKHMRSVHAKRKTQDSSLS